jgi:pilus assembly protein CpaE
MRVLLIDDEPFYHKLIRNVLKDADYQLEYAKSGQEGLAKISSFEPELLIVDLMLPEMDGFEILSRLRRDPKFNHIPVIVVTAKDELGEKLKAFEMGADDYLVKPFQPEELEARLGILARRGKAAQYVQGLKKDTYHSTSTVVTIHSLRGGLGCSSITLNLGLAFYKLWEKPTLLVDGVLTAGQLALMLDAKPTTTWESLVGLDHTSLDDGVVDQLTCSHESGIHFIASPRFPIAADMFTPETLHGLMEKLKTRHEFIVVDVSHDFSDMTIQMLSLSNTIVLVMAPEVASLRTTISALEVYDRIGIAPDKVKIVLNNNSSNPAIKQAQLEKILKRTPDFVLPFEPQEVNRALNYGKPFILNKPDLPICLGLEKMAFLLSDEIHRAIPPAIPSSSWKRVTSLLAGK